MFKRCVQFSRNKWEKCKRIIFYGSLTHSFLFLIDSTRNYINKIFNKIKINYDYVCVKIGRLRVISFVLICPCLFSFKFNTKPIFNTN